MERLLLVACPDLTQPGETAGAAGPAGGIPGDEGGRRLRQLAGVVDALVEICPWVDPVRAGVCVLPIKGPARYFGGDAAVLARVEAAVATVLGEDGAVQLGVAEGIFAAELAARSGLVVPPGGTGAFLAPWPVATLGVPDLCELLPRLGLRTLGALAALPTRDVLARFGEVGDVPSRSPGGWRASGRGPEPPAWLPGWPLSSTASPCGTTSPVSGAGPVRPMSGRPRC